MFQVLASDLAKTVSLLFPADAAARTEAGHSLGQSIQADEKGADAGRERPRDRYHRRGRDGPARSAGSLREAAEMRTSVSLARDQVALVPYRRSQFF